MGDTACNPFSATLTASVVCCRCAPSQKAQVCSLVRYSVKGATTLAIGDGANDVAMIQAAHIGVGISGQEGMQAANSADFSIGQFRFLCEMLLVWGRNNYRRMAMMIYYIFYKNILLTLLLFWYMYWCSATGTRIYIEAAIQGFNVFWTALPIVVCAIKDRDVSDELSRHLPQLYQLGVRRYYFNAAVTFRWLFDGIVESLFIFFCLVYGLPAMAATNGGVGGPRDPDFTMVGDIAFAIVLAVVTLKLALAQYQVTKAQHLAMLLCFLLWWPMSMIASWQSWLGSSLGKAFFQNYAGMFGATQATISYWLLLVLCPGTIGLFHVYLSAYQRAFYPEFRDLAMEAESWRVPGAKAWLAQWRIPSNQRKLPLRKDAPRPIDERSLLRRWLACCARPSKVSA